MLQFRHVDSPHRCRWGEAGAVVRIRVRVYFDFGSKNSIARLIAFRCSTFTFLTRLFLSSASSCLEMISSARWSSAPIVASFYSAVVAEEDPFAVVAEKGP